MDRIVRTLAPCAPPARRLSPLLSVFFICFHPHFIFMVRCLAAANPNSVITSVTFSTLGGQAVLSHTKLITSHRFGYIGQRRKNFVKTYSCA
jgi:hypothetical protein